MITQKIKFLNKLDQEEKYLEEKELLISAGLNIIFNKKQLTTFFNFSYTENSSDNNS